MTIGGEDGDAGVPSHLKAARAGRVGVVTYDVSIEDRPAQAAAVVSGSVSREDIPGFLSGAFDEIFGSLAAHAVQPVGPPFARYRIDGETFHVTAGVPLVSAAPASGRVEPGELPGGPVVSTVHTGSYETVPEAFHAVIEWIEQNGLTIAADPWECYLDGPEVPEPRTQVCFPVERA